MLTSSNSVCWLPARVSQYDASEVFPEMCVNNTLKNTILRVTYTGLLDIYAAAMLLHMERCQGSMLDFTVLSLPYSHEQEFVHLYSKYLQIFATHFNTNMYF